MVKFEVTGDERLTRTFLEGLTDVEPTESSTTAAEGRRRVNFPAKTMLFNLPLKQEKARVTLQLGVNTGNIQNMTVASLEDSILRMLVDLMRIGRDRQRKKREHHLLPRSEQIVLSLLNFCL